MTMTWLRQGGRCLLRLPWVVTILLALLLTVTATARWPGLQRQCLRWGAWALCQAFSVRLPAPLTLPASPRAFSHGTEGVLPGPAESFR